MTNLCFEVTICDLKRSCSAGGKNYSDKFQTRFYKVNVEPAFVRQRPDFGATIWLMVIC
jgi:hypothetical protein